MKLHWTLAQIQNMAWHIPSLRNIIKQLNVQPYLVPWWASNQHRITYLSEDDCKLPLALWIHQYTARETEHLPKEKDLFSCYSDLSMPSGLAAPSRTNPTQDFHVTFDSTYPVMNSWWLCILAAEKAQRNFANDITTFKSSIELPKNTNNSEFCICMSNTGTNLSRVSCLPASLFPQWRAAGCCHSMTADRTADAVHLKGINNKWGSVTTVVQAFPIGMDISGCSAHQKVACTHQPVIWLAAAS